MTSGLTPTQPEGWHRPRHSGAAASVEGDTEGANLARSGASMAAGTLVSRILGMVRGVLVTGVLGAGLTGSAFGVANTLPNNFYLLIAGGVL
ncbi:MAG: hypothetical protein ABI131_03710, partial [Nostocoides sp.]